MDKRVGPTGTVPDEPADDADAFDFPDENESAVPMDGWLGTIGQMIAALLVVFLLVALFIWAAVALRWLFTSGDPPSSSPRGTAVWTSS
jgi:hypothetical protein